MIGYLALRTEPPLAEANEPAAVSQRTGIVAIALLLGMLIALPILATAAQSPSLDLFGGIFSSGALVFGGGHVVLPLLHARVVDPGLGH